MAYVKNIWVDQDVERPKTYEVTNNEDGSITLTDSFGLVTELGTPVDEVNMNHIEDGIAGCAIRKHNLTETFELGEWVLGGSGDNEGLYKSLIANNIGNAITDTTAWEQVKMGGASGRNVGEVITSTLPLTDAGLHLLDGTLLQYGIYKEFIDYIADLYAENPTANYFTDETTWQHSVTTYGSCGKFVYDSVSKTVRLPKVSDILQSTTDINALGDLIEAGLPNITGNTVREIKSSSTQISTTEWYGAMGYKTGDSGSYGGSGTTYRAAFLFLDASKSNPIYGNSNTVQPQTIKAFVYIVVANSTKTSIQVDIDNIATDLNNKAGTDLANVTDTGKILMSEMGMPSDKYIDLTLGASGSTYTAPANGYVCLTLTSNTSGGNIWISSFGSNSNYSITSSNKANGAGVGLDVYIPIKKNQSFEVGYLYCKAFGTESYNRFVFIYAQGAESEAN